MSKNKNAHSAAATTEQAAENDAGRKIPHNDYTTGTGPISRLLSHGRANAAPLRHLTAMTKLGGRTVRAMIAAERLAGTPILSDNLTGYYLPGDDAVLAPGGISHSGPGENRQFWPDENSQS